MNGSSNTFGQSSNSLLGSSSVFGQTNSPNNIPFAALPSGCTSAAVFTQASSPGFGASSAPAFGSSMPAFVASSSPDFGASVCGWKPACGNFGSTTQSSSIGSSFQQSQPASGSNGSSPLGSSSQPAFASLWTSAIGTSSTPAFDATSTPAFGSTSTPIFGNTGFTFGNSGFSSSTPAFGDSSTPAFGASSTPAFGASSTPAFRTSSTPAFVSSHTPAFGATSSSFSFWPSPTSGKSTCAFGSSPFGATSTTFGAQSSLFGGQTTTPWRDNASDKQVVSISAMGSFQEKSHEELRWEYHQLKNLGGLNHAAQSSGGMGFDMNNTHQTNHPFASSPAANPFSSTTSTNPFVPKNSTFGTESSTPLGSSPFGSTPTTSSYLFGAPSSSPIGSSIPIYGTQAQGITSAVGTGLNFEKLESISAMPAYKEKSHEELKWEYCQLRNKGDNHCDLAYTVFYFILF